MKTISLKSYLICALICQILILITKVHTDSEHLLLQGEFCNETLHCNQSKLLTCQDTVCECILSDSMLFSVELGHCVSLADDPCGHMSMDTSDVLLQCVDDAFCNSQGYCQCHQGFFRSDLGTCLRQNEFGDPCISDGECLQELGIKCVNKTCNCNRIVSVDSLKFGTLFQEEERRCLGRADNPCLNGHCVPNAICKEMEDKSSKCTCQPGFEESRKKKGICLGSFNKTCDIRSNLLCENNLICLDGLCKCPHPQSQIYDKGIKTCLRLVGGICEISEINSCVNNAICQKGIVTSDHVCVCEEGFVENLERSCDTAYGQPCPYDSYHCDRLSGLACRDGFCVCPDPGQIFDKSLMKCRGGVGALCITSESNYCVEHANCVGHRNGRLFQGHCQCQEDYDVADDLTCECEYCDDEGRKKLIK